MSGEAASANVKDQMSLPHMGVHTTQVTRREAYLKACQSAPIEVSAGPSWKVACSLKVTMCDTRDEIRPGSQTFATVRPQISSRAES